MKKSMAAQLYPIDQYMTPSPHVIRPDETLAQARERMNKKGARHLPVIDDGKLVGIVSERDLLFLQSLTDVDPERIPVHRAMQTDVYGVDRDTPLDEVAATMAHHKYGSTVVWSGATVVGIFTTVDAMRALAAIVRERTKA
jgi:acetoin utilization protein AcuB